ncbi:sugar transferase [Campylobacter sp. MOP51]|uniref:sugar transferase n=1 Tax=Campylobacter canis TaxID=3378588 RepID=UPI003C4B258E
MQEVYKRLFDIIFSAMAIIFLSPLFISIYVLIKIKSPQTPVIFKHERIGKYGVPFKVYKFRTMIFNAEKILEKMLKENPEMEEEYKKDFKLKNDPRIIPVIGNFLRKYSLDELPQFFNALFGSMSIVGPRPIVQDELEKYGEYSDVLLTVKPGITGLWQVSGRNDIDYDERVAIDIQYIQNRSFLLDIEIIFKTILVIIFKKGAY